MIYILGWLLAFTILRVRCGVKIFGRNNIPEKGSFIFASNHSSNLDPFILGTSFYRPLDYLAKEELFRTRFSNWLFRSWHAHPVRRGDGDYRAMKEVFRILHSGKPLLIFPEGTRSKDGKFQPAKPGIGFMVYKTGVPVVPAYIEGSFEAMPEDLDTLKRHPIRVYIGEPMKFDYLRRDAQDRDIYQKISEDIMKRIAELKEAHAGKVS